MKKIKNLLMVILGNKFFSVLIENYISTRIRVNLKNISKFKSIDVYFICDDFSLFKYDNLYNRMIASDRYNPTILITKEKSFIYDNKSIKKKMNETKELFISRGYNVTKMNFLGYIGFHKFFLHQNIVFYCSPYAHTGFHFIRIVLKSLILYAPYSYGTIINQGIGSLWPQTINTIYIYTWSNFVESELHFKYNDFKLMKNPVLTGYMTYELIYARAKLNFESTKKVILYAPHYGVKIDDSEVYYRSSYSSFLEFYNIIEDLRHELGNKLIFIFKPHPALKMMLYRHPNWRKTKTDNYFNSWKTTFSTLYDNDYITAFNLSDCIVYDSVSFIGEYIYTNKPSLYLNNDINLYQNDAIRSYLMEFHYIGNSKDDAYTFLSDIVIDGNDYKKDIRSKFITSQFKNGLLDFSGNVIRFLNDSLKR